MGALLRDLRSALRGLAGRPGLSLTIVATLAVGIGVNTVVLSVVNGLLFKREPFADLQTLAWVLARGPGTGHGEATPAEARDLPAAARSFRGIVAEGRLGLALDTPEGVEQVWALAVSPDYFDVLGVRAERGRTFSATDAARPVVVIGHELASARFGEQGSLAGRTLVLNGRLVEVAGVLPAGSRGFSGLYTPQVWIALPQLDTLGLAHVRTSPDAWLALAGRLAPGATLAQARDELLALSRAMPREGVDRGTRRFVPAVMTGGHPDLAEVRPLSIVLVGAVGFVLVLACFNVAGLLLAQATERQREMAIRTALGAGRGAIVRLLVVESLLLAVAGGMAATLVGYWSENLLSAFRLPAPVPQQLDLGLDQRLIAMTALLVAAAGILPGLVPAWHVRRLDLVEVLKREGATTTGGAGGRLGRALLMVQVAGSTILLALAVLFVQSSRQASTTSPGFDTSRALTFALDPVAQGRPASAVPLQAEAVLDRLRALPGVRGAAATTRLPLGIGMSVASEVSLAGRPCPAGGCPRAGVVPVTAGYFEALGIPVVAGDGFRSGQALPPDAVVVDAATATLLAPDASLVGETLVVGQERFQVRGIVANVSHVSLGSDRRLEVYRVMAPADFAHGFSVVVRTAGDPGAAAPAVRQAVLAVDPAVPLQGLQTMDAHLALARWFPRTTAGLSLVCALVAGALAITGLFSIVHRRVTQRRRELGIRSALGASRAALLGMVLGDGSRLAMPGLLLGLVGAVVAARLVGGLLVGISPAEPLAWAAIVALQTGAVLAACVVPARAASRVDPLVVLRDR